MGLNLTVEQETKLLQQCRQYLVAPKIINQGDAEDYRDFDERRAAAIPLLRSLIEEFIDGKTSLVEFKEGSERLCRTYPYWGFKGFSGQMQLNQYVNSVVDGKKEKVLRNSILVPSGENEAKEKVDALTDYLASKRMSTESPRSFPRLTQSYLLSYFWELQDPIRWPVYYGSSRKVLLNLGVPLDSAASPGSEYISFLRVMREIAFLFDTEHKSKYPFWFVEHVLWTNFMQATPSVDIPVSSKRKKGLKPPVDVPTTSLFGEWIPEIVRDLTDLSFNKETPWSTRANLKPEKAFERKLAFAFTLLGYETQELGQGTGREPDGVALSINVPDGDYAIVYDAKAREGKFAIGTGDREIFEYIQKKKDLLKREKRIHKLYFVIVSSDFDDRSAQESLRSIYRRTQVPTTMLKASDLLFVVDTKLQDLQIDHAKLEDLFLDSGIITREKIIDLLGVR